MTDSESDECTGESGGPPELVHPKKFAQRQFALTKRTLEATDAVLAESQELEALRTAAERCEVALASGDRQALAQQVQKCREVAEAAARANGCQDELGPMPKCKTDSAPASLLSWRPSFKGAMDSTNSSIVEPPGAADKLVTVREQAEVADRSEEAVHDTSSGESESQEERLDEVGNDTSQDVKADSNMQRTKALADRATREQRYQDGLTMYTELLNHEAAVGQLRVALLCNAAHCALKLAPDQPNWAYATHLLRSIAAWTNEALNIDPDNAKAHFRRGCALECLEQFREAYLAYSAAAELIPEDSCVKESLARVSRYSEQELGPEISSLLRRSKQVLATQRKADKAAAKKEKRTRFQKAVETPEPRLLPQLEPKRLDCCYCTGNLKGADGFFARPCGHGPFCGSCCRQIDAVGHELPLCPICMKSASSTASQTIIAEWVTGSEVEPPDTEFLSGKERRKKFGPRRPPEMAAEAAKKQPVFPPRFGPEAGIEVKEPPTVSSFLACMD
eukprot:TRINITY_DN32690_c0_g1_i1.p1 TRINITY_DN32690_c0_g1~~TRINITY_DN32690_c0_g1_i1.p1  ORF type:complete len:507 (-),score=91.01 TRINITY_DN32690_c0_g1_i1:431-1951(-)